MLTHFDTDREPVSRAMEIRMLALLADRHVLDRLAVVDGEVPDKIADSIAGFGLWRSQRATLEGDGMTLGIGMIILRAVYGDVSRSHRPDDLSSVSPLRHHVGPQVHLTIHAGNGGLSAR